MKRRAAALYLDEDVDVLVGTLLRSVGFDVVNAHEAHRKALSDVSQFQWATEQNRAIVTHNRRDFARLVAAAEQDGREHAGVFIAKRRRAHAVAARILAVVNTRPADEIRNRVHYV